MPATSVDAQRAERLALARKIEAAVQAAVRDALLEHKRAGRAIVCWRDGRVEWVPPEKIPVTDDDEVQG